MNFGTLNLGCIEAEILQIITLREKLQIGSEKNGKDRIGGRSDLRGLPHGREPHPLLAHERAVG